MIFAWSHEACHGIGSRLQGILSPAVAWSWLVSLDLPLTARRRRSGALGPSIYTRVCGIWPQNMA